MWHYYGYLLDSTISGIQDWSTRIIFLFSYIMWKACTVGGVNDNYDETQLVHYLTAFKSFNTALILQSEKGTYYIYIRKVLTRTFNPLINATQNYIYNI